MSQPAQPVSTKPYLIRALHAWCTDSGLTPYLAVQVDASVRVPREFVQDDEIVLNIGFEACGGLQLGNELITFQARFGGVARDIAVPVSHVTAIYARENGQGMAFPAPEAGADSDAIGAAPAPLHAVPAPPADTADSPPEPPPSRPPGGHLRRVK